MLKQLSALGYLVLLSTHNPEHAFLFADNVLVLHNGNIMAQGNPREALTASLLEEIYRIPIQLYTSPDIPNAAMYVITQNLNFNYLLTGGIYEKEAIYYLLSVITCVFSFTGCAKEEPEKSL